MSIYSIILNCILYTTIYIHVCYNIEHTLQKLNTDRIVKIMFLSSDRSLHVPLGSHIPPQTHHPNSRGFTQNYVKETSIETART